jgi:hypothetical protein
MQQSRLLEWLKNKLTAAPQNRNITLHLRLCAPYSPGCHLESQRMTTVERYVDLSNQHLLEATILMLGMSASLAFRLRRNEKF